MSAVEENSVFGPKATQSDQLSKNLTMAKEAGTMETDSISEGLNAGGQPRASSESTEPRCSPGVLFFLLHTE